MSSPLNLIVEEMLKAAVLICVVYGPDVAFGYAFKGGVGVGVSVGVGVGVGAGVCLTYVIG